MTVARDADADVGWSTERIAALVVVGTGGFLTSIVQSVLVPVLPQIQRDLGSSPAATQWLLTSTLLVGAVAVPVVGRLADLFGKKLMLLAASATLVVGSLTCALSTSIAPMIVGRVIVGVSVVAVPVGISLISVTFPRELAASGIAYVSATLGIGGALGLPIAGLVAEHADYHVLFWITVIGGILAFTGIALALPETRTARTTRMDYPGTAIMIAALTCLLLPLSQATQWGWSSRRTVLLLVAAAALGVLFVLYELRRTAPLVDIRTNRRPAILYTNVASLCVGFALYASLIGTAPYVEAPRASGYGFASSILVSGLCLLPSGLAMLLFAPLSAWMSNRYGAKVTLATGSSIVALGFVERIVFTSNIWEIVLGTTIAGIGTGVAYAAMPSLIAAATPPERIAAANGLNSLFRIFGSSLSSAVGGTILAANLISVADLAVPSLAAYRTLFAACAASALLGAAIALVVPAAKTSAGPPTR